MDWYEVYDQATHNKFLPGYSAANHSEPPEVEAPIRGMRTIVTSEGIVFQGSQGQVLCEPSETLREALSEINVLRQALKRIVALGPKGPELQSLTLQWESRARWFAEAQSIAKVALKGGNNAEAT